MAIMIHLLCLKKMGNQPSGINNTVTVATTDTRSVTESDQPVGCCMQFQKVTSKINSKFSCCKRSTVINVQVEGNSNQTNVEVT